MKEHEPIKNYFDLCEAINSPTLGRDLQYMADTGENPAGYFLDELQLMREYLQREE